MDFNDTYYLTEEYAERIAQTLLPNIILQCTVLFIGVLGNILVLVMYCTKMNGDLTEPRYFIPVLTVMDLLACLSAVVYFVTDTYMWMSYYSDVLCKAVIFTNGYTIGTSNTFLLVLAIQRYQKLCRPHSRRMSLFWRRITMVLVILANFVYSIPTLVLSGVGELSLVYNNTNISGMSCFTGTNEYPEFEIVYYGFAVVISVVYILLTMGFYIPVALAIYQNFNRRRMFQQPRNNSMETSQNASSSFIQSKMSSGKEIVQNSHVNVPLSKYRKCKTNFTLMFFIIITIYIASYIPTYVILILTKSGKHFWTDISFSEFAIYNALVRTYVVNHVTNPFVYVYFDTRLRQSVTSIFCRRSVQ